MTLDVAVVGAGIVSNQHLSGAERSPRSRLVAVCDLDRERATTTADRYDIAAYSDLDELFANEDLDVVHVCTPVQTHALVAEKAIESGVAVLLEKPATESVDELDALEALANRRGVPISVVHQHLFSPAMRKARRLVDEGAIGSVRGVDLVYTGFSEPDERNRGEWVFDLQGGEFEEGLPHPLYLGLSGGYPRSAEDVSVTTSLLGDYGGKFTYDAVQLQFVTDSGGLASFKILSGGHATRLLHVHGSEGTVTVDFVSQTVLHGDRPYLGSALRRVRKNVDESVTRLWTLAEMASLVARDALTDDWELHKQLDPHHYQIDETYRAIEAGEEPPVPIEDARWTLTLMQQIRDAATEGRTRSASSPKSEL